jgi:flagellar biosynthesis protein FlhB
MADNETGQERTEAPTPRRRELARQEGRVARSHELAAATVLLSGAAMLATTGGSSIGRFTVSLFQECTELISAGPLGAAGAITLLRKGTLQFLTSLVPFAAAITGVVLLVDLAQTRGVLSTAPVTPKLTNISPGTGLKRIFSGQSLFTLLKSLVKLAILGLLTYGVIARSWPELTSLAEAGPTEVIAVLRNLLCRLALLVGLAFLGISVFDYFYQRYSLEKSLRMTRTEVIQEHKESEGDPLVKSRIRTLMRAQARKRMLQRVPLADVVVTNPTEIAVALKYDPDVAPAPIVVAMGQRKLAERIRAIAVKSNVPIVENRPVARALLATGKVGKQIPSALYIAVAEILAFVYRKRAAVVQATNALLNRGEAWKR